MRSIACAVLVTLAGGESLAAAQERQIGLKAGVNVASVVFDGDPSGGYNERRVGFLAGGFAVLPVSGPVAVQIEALFSQKGAKISVEDESLEATLELDYLDVPVMLRVQGPVLGNNRLHFFGGPSVAFRTGSRSKLSDQSFEFAQGSIDNIEDSIEPFDLGIVAGAGLDIGRRVVVDARYSWGLSTINKDTSAGIEMKNRLFSIMAGVRF
ncbi:MAG: PorT family protein [Acidobacteriota bacterium]|nr:PorT family protein [Acidobacteriota bacterium]